MGTQIIDPDAFNAFEAAGWETRAATYTAAFTEITGRVVGPLLDLAGVGPGSRVLDVACGPGHVTAACAARGAAVVGVDIAHAMVAVASTRYPGVEFRQDDAQCLTFADASMGAIVGNFAILHVGRPERAVAEFARVLVPNGRLALSTWDLPTRARLIGVFLDAAAEAGASQPANVPNGPPFFRFSDDAEFVRLLDDAGLRDVEVRTIAFTHRFPSTVDGHNGGMTPARDAPGRFVGRGADLQRLEAALAAAATGVGASVLVSGEAGIGKTRLMAELAERAHSRGYLVLKGVCIDLVGAGVPYLPLTDALRPCTARGRGAAWNGLSALSRLVAGHPVPDGRRRRAQRTGPRSGSARFPCNARLNCSPSGPASTSSACDPIGPWIRATSMGSPLARTRCSNCSPVDTPTCRSPPS